MFAQPCRFDNTHVTARGAVRQDLQCAYTVPTDLGQQVEGIRGLGVEAAGRPCPDVLTVWQQVVEVGPNYLTAMGGGSRREWQGKRQRPSLRRGFPSLVVFKDVFAADTQPPCADEAPIHPQAQRASARSTCNRATSSGSAGMATQLLPS